MALVYKMVNNPTIDNWVNNIKIPATTGLSSKIPIRMLEIKVGSNGLDSIDRYVGATPTKDNTAIPVNKTVCYRENITTTFIVELPQQSGSPQYTFTATMHSGSGAANIYLEYSTDGVNFIRNTSYVLTPSSSTSSTYTLTTYFPFIRANITSNTGEVSIESSQKIGLRG